MSSLKQPQQAIRRSCLVFHMQTYLTIATPFKLNKESNQASEMTFDFQAPCQSLWLFVKACPIEERLCSSPFLVNYNIYIYCIVYEKWQPHCDLTQETVFLHNFQNGDGAFQNIRALHGNVSKTAWTQAGNLGWYKFHGWYNNYSKRTTKLAAWESKWKNLGFFQYFSRKSVR